MDGTTDLRLRRALAADPINLEVELNLAFDGVHREIVTDEVTIAEISPLSMTDVRR